jgi:hypothetical protein
MLLYHYVHTLFIFLSEYKVFIPDGFSGLNMHWIFIYNYFAQSFSFMLVKYVYTEITCFMKCFVCYVAVVFHLNVYNLVFFHIWIHKIHNVRNVPPGKHLLLCDEIRKHVDEGKLVGAVFIDFKVAHLIQLIMQISLKNFVSMELRWTRMV